jgi:L-ornithine N5-monooxygenase
MQIFDLIGVGFGPSNLALAIALDRPAGPEKRIESFFIEKQSDFAWHSDMLLEDAHMQISFLKDLVTLRDPTSPYTFLNYLHQSKRLQDFINLKTFYPSRHEFNDYLRWAARQFTPNCAYGEQVIELHPERMEDVVELIRVRSRDSEGLLHERLARNVVIGVGGAANIPESFAHLKDDPRVFHSSHYLSRIEALEHPQRIAVVGIGQSAAEIFLDLEKRFATAHIDLITRARSIKPSDDSPFVNEIFNAEYTDYIFKHTDAERASLIEEFMNTNYAAPDLELVEKVFNALYLQRVRGRERLRFLRRREIVNAHADQSCVRLGLKDYDTGGESSLPYDAIILATGYTRKQHESLLSPLRAFFQDFTVDRDYRIRSRADFRPAIFLQGSCESTHGLADTLLSLIAIRSEEIKTALLRKHQSALGEPHLRAIASH